MKTEYISKVLDSLRAIFPDLTFLMWDKDDRGIIYVSTLTIPEKKVVKFNPELLEMQFDKGNEVFFKETIKMFAEIIDRRFVKKINKYSNRMRRKEFLLTSAQIKYAIANTKSCNGAAKSLGVDLRTFKKYAFLHGLETEYNKHRNPSGAGVLRPAGHYAKMPLIDIIKNNKHPNYDIPKLKRRLISECILEEKCEQCGYNEKREYDQSVPLILDFKDGNNKNKHIDNMHLICYNCAYLVRPLGGKLSTKYTKHVKELLADIKEHIISDISESTFNTFNPILVKKDTADLFDKFNSR